MLISLITRELPCRKRKIGRLKIRVNINGGADGELICKKVGKKADLNWSEKYFFLNLKLEKERF